MIRTPESPASADTAAGETAPPADAIPPAPVGEGGAVERLAEIRREWDAGRDICRHTEWLLAYAEGEAHRDRVIAQQTHYLLAAEARVSRLTAALQAARAALGRHATHARACEAAQCRGSCDCGLDGDMDAVDEAMREVERG